MRQPCNTIILILLLPRLPILREVLVCDQSTSAITKGLVVVRTLTLLRSAAQQSSGGVIGVGGCHADLGIRDQTYLIQKIGRYAQVSGFRFRVSGDIASRRGDPMWSPITPCGHPFIRPSVAMLADGVSMFLTSHPPQDVSNRSYQHLPTLSWCCRCGAGWGLRVRLVDDEM